MSRSRSRSPIKFAEDNAVEESQKDINVSQGDVSMSQKNAVVSHEEAKQFQEDVQLSQEDTGISWRDTLVSQKDEGVSAKDTRISQVDAEISHENVEMSQEHVEGSWDDSQMSREDAEISDVDTEVSNDADVSYANKNKNNAECCEIVIENIPKSWHHQQAYQFIQEMTKSVAILNGLRQVKMIRFDGNPIGRCVALFKCPQLSKMALKEWSTLCKEKKYFVKYDHEKLLNQQKRYYKAANKKVKPVNYIHCLPQPFDVSNEEPWRPEPDSETFGISPNILKRLNIKLPLCNAVFIRNLEPNVTEAKIRQVFSYAGSIRNSKLVSWPTTRFAVVEYDHEVEAVQAISMFHNRELYGRPMVVNMKHAKTWVQLPDGLGRMGPGLGLRGNPVRGARIAMEIESLKRTLNKEINKVTHANSNQTTNVPNVNSFLQSGAIFPTINQMPVIPPPNNPSVVLTPIMPCNFRTPQPVPMANMQLLSNTNQQNTNALQQASNPILQNKIIPNVDAMSQASLQAFPWQTSVPANTQNDSSQPGYSRVDIRPEDFRNNQNNVNHHIKLAPNVADMSQSPLQASPWQTSVPANTQNDSTQPGYSRIDNRNNQNNDNYQMKMAPNVADISQALLLASPWQISVPANTQNDPEQSGYSGIDCRSNDYRINQNNDNNQIKMASNVANMPQASLQASWQTSMPANTQNDSTQPGYSRMDIRPDDYKDNQNIVNHNIKLAPNVADMSQASFQTSSWQSSASANTQDDFVQLVYSCMDISSNDNKNNQNNDNHHIKLEPNEADMPQASFQTSSWQSKAPSKTQNDSAQSRHSRKDSKSNENRNKKDNHQKKNRRDDKYDKREKPRSSSRDERRSKSEKTDMLLFKNLPPSVSVKVLTSKMKEVGEVKFAELTGSGRAIIRFARNKDTKRCIQLYHKSRVDGKTIEVNYF